MDRVMARANKSILLVNITTGERCAPGGSRTHTGRVLSPLPLPVGLRGRVGGWITVSAGSLYDLPASGPVRLPTSLSCEIRGQAGGTEVRR